MYAVFTAALVLGSNVGEDLMSSWNRVAGTVMGAATGMLVAVLMGPSASAVAVGTGLTVLGTMTVGLGLPAARIGATMCVVLLMTHVGDATRYSLLRLANTAVGIVVGMAVSFLVWPVRGGDALARAVREVLAGTAEALGAIRDGTLAAVTPAQLRVLDGIGTALKALTDARRLPLSQNANGVLGERCRNAIEAGLYAVSASATLARVDPSPATAGALAAMRGLAAALASRLAVSPGSMAAGAAGPNLEELEHVALLEATRPEIDAPKRLLLAGVLNDFRSFERARVALDGASTSPAGAKTGPSA